MILLFVKLQVLFLVTVRFIEI